MRKTSLLCGILVLALVGCGQKGPLYLPQPAKPSSDAPKAAPEPATQSTKELKQDSTQKSAGY